MSEDFRCSNCGGIDYTCTICAENDLAYAVRQKDMARDLYLKTVTSLWDAQEASENYWEVWQDAAFYWKGSRDEAREFARRAWEELTGIQKWAVLRRDEKAPEWLTGSSGNEQLD